MAEIVLGLASSHTPQMSTSAEFLKEHAARDERALIHSAGCRPPARESYSPHFILEETIAVASLLAAHRREAV